MYIPGSKYDLSFERQTLFYLAGGLLITNIRLQYSQIHHINNIKIFASNGIATHDFQGAARATTRLFGFINGQK